MERQLVSSSNLKSVGYVEETQVLEVEFKSGAVYQYCDVPVSLVRNLLGAGSVGSFFVANIKDNYSFKKL